MVKKINESALDYEMQGEPRPDTYDDIYKEIMILLNDRYGHFVRDYDMYARISNGVYEIANAIFNAMGD